VLCLIVKVSRNIAFPIIACSLILAILAQELFIAPGIGFNVAIVSLVTAICTIYLIKKQSLQTKIPKWMIVAPMLVASYGLAIPDSVGLDRLNLLVFVLTLGLVSVIHASTETLSVVKTAIIVPFQWLVIPVMGLVGVSYVDWNAPGAQRKILSRGILLGALCSAPALLIFGIILSNADPMFGKLLSVKVSVTPEEAIQRCALFAAVAFSLLGFWTTLSPTWILAISRGMGNDPTTVKPIYAFDQGKVHEMLGPNPPASEFIKYAHSSEHVIAFSTFLGCISGLFTLFVAVQLRYLFGGSAVVLQTENLTYAQYARQGFLEIFSVTCLTVPLLLVGQGFFERMENSQRKNITTFAGVASSLLVLLLASATYRLFLYVDAYGMSTLRFYTATGIVWLGVVIGAYFWFGLRWQLLKVGYAAFIGLVGIVMVCNVIRPDSVIARISLSRSQNKGFDDEMVMELGADAYPVINRMGDQKLKDSWLKNFERWNRNWKSTTLSEIQAETLAVTRAPKK
jgi:hypothetical protein